MKTRSFGKKNIKISEIGLGTWQLGSDWGDVDEKTAMETLAAAVESGVNFFDTADVYGLGKSERYLGKFLRDSGADVFVATKLGRFPEPGWPKNFTFEAFRNHTEASLQRLGLETLALTQLHCIPTEVLRRGKIFDWLRTLQKEGIIKRFGVSVESMDEALCCLHQDGLSSLQIIFNIFRQKPITTLFDSAKEKGVALVIRLPLASGLLSGKLTIHSQFDKSDHRNYNRNGEQFNVGETFAGIQFEKGVELVDELKSMLPANMTMAQMALRWILDFDAVSVVIPGSKKAEQVCINAAASDLAPLSAELHKKLGEFYKELVVEHIRGAY